MTDRNELQKLVNSLNHRNLYTWFEKDSDGYITGVGSQLFKNSMVLSPITAAEKMRDYLWKN